MTDILTLTLTMNPAGGSATSTDKVAPECACFAPSLPIDVVSAIGAGDSFVGAVVWAFARALALKDAILYGVAAGCAALRSEGTGLCRPADVAHLQRQITLT